MKYCILNKQTNICENIIMLDSPDQFTETPTSYLCESQEGNIGWLWSPETKTWKDPRAEVDDDTLAAVFRVKRRNLLKQHVDSINPIRWAAMTEEEQQKYVDYRQTLLDIPSQPGFPKSYTLPKAP